MSYQKEIRIHFENYRTRFFPNKTGGKWRNSELDYPHILPKEDEKLNLLEPYRESLDIYLKENKSSLKPHIYFHHLNSSQAMCLNFFFPLVEEKELDVILKFIGFENEVVIKSCFEKKSPIENKDNKRYRPTCFDFYIETNSGKEIFFEIKYTEQKFGYTKDDDKGTYITKFNDVYKGNLEAIKEEYHEPKTFFKNYQILRNLICVAENSYVVFLYPDGNKKIKNQAEFAKSNILKNELSDSLKNLTWEKLLDYTQKNVKSVKLKNQFKDFKEKYNI